MRFEIAGVHEAGPGQLRAHLVIHCAKPRPCTVPLRQGAAKAWSAGHVWGWDGKTEAPSVTPSVNCSQCGFHKTLVKGAWQ